MGSLTEWLDMREAWVLALEEFDLPRDFILDYSADSLRRLEEVLSDLRGGGPGTDYEGAVRGAAAYFGEALVRTGAGSWGWDDTADAPLVVPDRRLDLSPVAPMAEVQSAARELRGRLTALHGDWERAAGTLPDRPVDRIVGWLARQEAAFPSWVAAYAPDISWDFTRDSLDALEEVVRRVASSPEELMTPERSGFRDVASWYFGEVLRRGLGGSWESSPKREFVMVGPTREKIIPVLDLKQSHETPGHLREWYDLYADTEDP